MRLSLPEQTVRSSEDNLIPLINVVFLMLVFFMVAGQILPSDAFKVTPPQARAAAPAPRDALTILMNSEGRVALDGETLSLAALADRLAARLAAQPETPPQIAVKVDAGLPASKLNGLLDALRAAGAGTATLFTTSTADGGPPR